MKWTKHIVVALLLASGISGQAQQLPQYSGYYLNKYALNPAAAGSFNWIDLRLLYRKQWTGFENAPETQLFSGHSSIENTPVGVGGYAFNDKHGISKSTGGGLTYAHHLPLNEDLRLSFGLTGHFAQYSIDGSAMLLDNTNDLVANAAAQQADGIFNASFGTYLYGDDYWVGLSALNLLPTEPEYFTIATQEFKTHINIMAGYNVEVGQKWTLTPSTYVNMVSGNPTAADFRFYVDYWETVQFGAGVRTDGALIFGGGVGITPVLNLSYSYDMTTSSLKYVSSGTHEVHLNYIIFYNALYKKDRKRYKLNLVEIKDKDKNKPKEPKD